MSLVRQADLTGPSTRLCIGPGGAVPCIESATDVRLPGQTVLPADGSWRRLMAVWPDEVVEVWLVCIDETTQDLVCPDSLRLRVRTVDDTGALVGHVAASA